MLAEVSIDWLPLLPGWAIALMAMVLLALLAHGCTVLLGKRVPRRSVASLAMLRVAAIVIFVLCLLQPAVSYVREATRQPKLLVLVDSSQSMAIQPDDAAPSRWKSTMTALDDSGLGSSLDEQFDARWFAFSRRARPIERSELTKLEPQGTSTELAQSLESALEFLSADGASGSPAAKPDRVLLVSDGHDRGTTDIADVARRWNLPIDVLPAEGAKPQAGDNVATVRRVQAAKRVLLGSETRFQVAIDAKRKESLQLVLLEDGKQVQAQEITLTGPGEQRVEVPYRPIEPGLKRYELTLAKVGAAAAPDDRYGVNVQVVDDKIELLVLEDRWRWEFKYLRRVLEDDPTYNLTALLARGGGAFVHIGEPERHVNLGGFPQSRTELNWFDVIVLGDVHATRWPKGLAAALADSVIESGKSLVVIAGPGIEELAELPELHALLPVELSKESSTPIEGPLPVRLTPEAAATPLLTGGMDASGELPLLDRIYAPLRKRPAAAVLLEAAEQANAAGPLIVMARQNVGRGQTFYIGTDSLWKWHTLTAPNDEGQTLYTRLWQQLLRSMTPRRTSSGSSLWLETDRSRYEAGDRVSLRAQISDDEPTDGLSVQATVILPDERRLPLVLTPDANKPGLFAAEFDATQPGRTRISASATADGQTVAESFAAVEVTPLTAELDAAEVDRPALERIAQRTGGHVVVAADKSTWPTAPEGLDVVHVRHIANLWENFSLLTLLFLVLGGDWLLRMLRGLT